MNGCALGLALMKRLRLTRKWAIRLHHCWSNILSVLDRALSRMISYNHPCRFSGSFMACVSERTAFIESNVSEGLVNSQSELHFEVYDIFQFVIVEMYF